MYSHTQTHVCETRVYLSLFIVELQNLGRELPIMSIHMCTHTYPCMFFLFSLCIYTHTQTHTHVTHVYTCLSSLLSSRILAASCLSCLYTCVHTHIHVCFFFFLYVFTHTHTHTQTHTHVTHVYTCLSSLLSSRILAASCLS